MGSQEDVRWYLDPDLMPQECAFAVATGVMELLGGVVGLKGGFLKPPLPTLYS